MAHGLSFRLSVQCRDLQQCYVLSSPYDPQYNDSMLHLHRQAVLIRKGSTSGSGPYASSASGVHFSLLEFLFKVPRLPEHRT